MTTLSIDTLTLRAPSASDHRIGLRLLVPICLLCAVVGRLAYLPDAFNGDGAMFAYMGKLAAEGGQFGVDLIDNKFPTAGFITSIFWRAFGDFWPGYVIAQMLLAAGAALALTRSAVRSFGEEARWATFLPAIVLLNLNAAVMGGFQLETIQTFFACIGGACALEALRTGDWRDALAVGLCAGCATLVKPTGGAVMGAFVLAVLIRRPVAMKLAISCLLGVAIPLLMALGWLMESDQLRILPEIARQISEYARSTSFDAFDLYRPISVLFLFGMALLIRGWVYRRRATEGGPDRAAWVFMASWITIEFIGVLMQRRMYAYHFLPLAGPAALIFGALPRRTTAGQLAGVLALPLVLGFWGSVETIQLAQRQPQNWPAVTQWLEEHAFPGERIWRDQTPYVLLHSDLRPASRIQLTFIFMNSDDSPRRFGRMLIDDLREHRPRYVVLPAGVDEHIHHQTTHVSELARIPARREAFSTAWKQIEAFVESGYEPVIQFGEEMIWQVRGPFTSSEGSPTRLSRYR